MSNPTPREVLNALKLYYNAAELEELALFVDIPYGNLEGNSPSARALALVKYTQRHGKYDDLVQEMATHPQVNWNEEKPITLNNKLTASDQDQKQPTQVINVYGTLNTGDTTTTIAGDQITDGNKIGGDSVGGDKTNMGDISNSSGIAVGDSSSAEISNQSTSQENTPQATTAYHIHGNVTGSTIGGGTVNAQNIAGGDITISTKEEFQAQLATLEALIQEAIANHEIPADEAADVYDDMQDATKEIVKETPSAKRLTSRLEYVQEVLEKSAGVATAAAKVGSAVLKATPIVAGLLKAASILF